MTWKPAEILAELKRLHESGESLSYRTLGRRNRPLLSAAVYRFGSYRQAVEQAGIDYEQFMRRPRWTRASIIDLIRQAADQGQNLNWAAVTMRDDDLRRGAYASLQKRLFGSWTSALEAAQIDVDQVRSYRRWQDDSIAEALRQRHHGGERMSSSAVQRENASLHAAALRRFGSFDAALKAAGIDPATCRVRRRWTRSNVLQSIRDLFEGATDGRVDETTLRERDNALHRAAIRLFGSVHAANRALRRAPGRAGNDAQPDTSVPQRS